MDQGKEKVSPIDWGAVGETWALLQAQIGPISFEFTRESAERMSVLLDGLVEATSDKGAAPALHHMLNTVAEWVAEYERIHVPIAQADPVELLRHLMESNGLVQRDLAGLLGGQPSVSAILNRKRRITAKQAVALGRRFKLSPMAFLSDEDHIGDENRAHPTLPGIKMGNERQVSTVTTSVAGGNEFEWEEAKVSGPVPHCVIQ